MRDQRSSEYTSNNEHIQHPAHETQQLLGEITYSIDKREYTVDLEHLIPKSIEILKE